MRDICWSEETETKTGRANFQAESYQRSYIGSRAGSKCFLYVWSSISTTENCSIIRSFNFGHVYWKKNATKKVQPRQSWVWAGTFTDWLQNKYEMMRYFI